MRLHRLRSSTSAVPPAASIFSAADAAELVRRHRERLRRARRAPSTLTGRRLRDQAALAQQLRRHRRCRRRTPRRARRGSRPRTRRGRCCEAALRHAAVERHLAALEPALALEARARLRALVPRPAVLPLPEPGPRPTRFLACFAPLGGLQIAAEFMLRRSFPSLLLDDQVPDLEDHARASPACPSSSTDVCRCAAGPGPATIVAPASGRSRCALRTCVTFSVFGRRLARPLLSCVVAAAITMSPPSSSSSLPRRRAIGRGSLQVLERRRTSPAPRCAGWPSRATWSARSGCPPTRRPRAPRRRR